LLAYSAPECAHIDLAYEWDCQNPERFGWISRSFRKELQIYFDPGCEGEVCFWASGAQLSPPPEVQEVCFNSPGDGLSLEAEIRDNCDTALANRNIPAPSSVDMEELIQFYVKMSYASGSFQFPASFHGHFYACGLDNDIVLTKESEGPGYAVYGGGAPQTVRELVSFCTDGAMKFTASYGKKAEYAGSIMEVDFTIKDKDGKITFVNDIPINSGTNKPTACYPFGEHLAFGTAVEAGRHGWPDTCRDFRATVFGYREGIATIETEGTIEPGEFTTWPATDDYFIDGNTFKEKNLTYKWKVAVDAGPERAAWPNQTIMKIFHGFMANDIVFSPPLPPGDTVSMGHEVDIVANPYPYLTEQDRIEYEWFWEPTGELQGAGHYQYDLPTKYKSNKFIPDYPGDVQLHYRITDQMSSTFAESPEPHKVIHIKPEITITSPAPGSKFVYSTGVPGVLTIDATATAVPQSLANDIEWSIWNIDGSVLTTNPSPPLGSSVTFTYTDLPHSNDEFGDKYVIASIPAYYEAESVLVRAYFPVDSDISNHGVDTTPNWFYYWQTGAVVPQMAGVLYDPSFPNTPFIKKYGETKPNGTIYIGPAADEIHYPCQNPGPNCYGFLINGIPFGGDHVNGIDCTAEVVAHEQYHAWVFANWRTGQWLKVYGPWTPGQGGNDRDGDWLPNEYETLVSNTDPDNCDTHNVSIIMNNPNYYAHGDTEYMAMRQANGATGLVSKDWSAGLYSKQWP
jgi:hypothetical protein